MTLKDSSINRYWPNVFFIHLPNSHFQVSNISSKNMGIVRCCQCLVTCGYSVGIYEFCHKFGRNWNLSKVLYDFLVRTKTMPKSELYRHKLQHSQNKHVKQLLSDHYLQWTHKSVRKYSSHARGRKTSILYGTQAT